MKTVPSLEALKKANPWPSPERISGQRCDLDQPPDRTPILPMLTGKETVILEVGTVFGGSARAFLQSCPQAKVICLGEWPPTILGKGREEWSIPGLSEAVDWVWETFLNSTEDLRDKLVPMRCPVPRGLKELQQLGILPQVIYYEGGTSYEESKRNLQAIRDCFPETLLLGRLTDDGQTARALSDLKATWSVPVRRWGPYWSVSRKRGARRPRVQPLILSLHIPKTAGTSFGRILESHFGDRLMKVYKTRPDVVPDDVFCLHGHLADGAIYYGYENVRPVTWLRNPTKRVISHYQFFLRRPDLTNPAFRALHEQNLSLLEFASLPGVANRQLYFVDEIGLENFEMVGITEHFSQSLKLFAHIFGISTPLSAIHSNTSPPGFTVDPGVYQKITELNAADWELYEKALERFHRATTS